MKLIVISYPTFIPNEAMLIVQLFQHGLENFHLRKPEWEITQLEQLLSQIPVKFRNRIVIHDHFHLAEKYLLAGIHFTKRTKPQMDKWITFPGSKSISCHHIEELKSLNESINYAFISPVFDSISKDGYKSNLNFQELQSFLKKNKTMQIVALGGISEKNITKCQQLGFDGVAVLGSIWKGNHSADEVISRFTKIQKACQIYAQM